MEAIITEVFADVRGIKHPLHGKKVEKENLERVYANIITTSNRSFPLTIREGPFLYTRDIRGVSGDVEVKIPDHRGFHDVHLQLGRFRCQLEYTVR